MSKMRPIICPEIFFRKRGRNEVEISALQKRKDEIFSEQQFSQLLSSKFKFLSFQNIGNLIIQTFRKIFSKQKKIYQISDGISLCKKNYFLVMLVFSQIFLTKNFPKKSLNFFFSKDEYFQKFSFKKMKKNSQKKIILSSSDIS